MATHKIKLYYFDGKGRAEVIRLLLAASGKQYEDIRFKVEDWPKYKPLAPLGKCPFLDMDGKLYHQSIAIKSYLAREFGFYGQTNLECFQIDLVIQMVEDMIIMFDKYFFMDDGEEKDKELEKLRTEDNPTFLCYFEKLLKENGTGYFVGDRMTLADIAVFDVATGMLAKSVDIKADKYPMLKKNVEMVREHKNIGQYVKSRPETPF